MNILFVSKNLIAGNVAYLLKKEGHSVKLYVEDENGRKNFDNLLEKVDSWEKELDWVGKEGLIVFDDVGFGKQQDKLRKEGYRVFGGSELGDKLELDREYGQKIFAECGLTPVLLKDFEDMDDAAVYVKKNPKAWVIKQNNQNAKFLNYVGQLDNGEDVLGVLRNFLHNPSVAHEKVSLQEKINGVEIGIGRYFNGQDWVGPIEFNIEHTRFFPGDIGPLTSEMGTLAWLSDDEKNKLYLETLDKMKTHLQKIDFRGDFEINCIVNEEGVFPIEATARFGTPIVHLHTEMFDSPWGEFLYAVASGSDYDLKWKKGYGIVMLVATPPFPYATKIENNIFYGVNIYLDRLTQEEQKHIHLEEVSVRYKDKSQYFISDNQGYVLYVTAMAEHPSKAREKVNNLASKIVIPKMIYRNDLGKRFEEKDGPLLEKWGYFKFNN